MSKPQKVKCDNCGREIAGVRAAQNDGWLLNEFGDGHNFCCCVCKSEFYRNEKKKKR